MRGTIVKGLVTLAISTLGIAFAADPIEIDFTPVFDNYGPDQGFAPVRVDITNVGPDAKGELRVTSQNDFASYPVDLPTGARKTFFTYGQCDWSGQHFTLVTDRGQIRRDLLPRPRDNSEDQTPIALIGSTPGALTAIRQSNTKALGVTWLDSYVFPSFAPDRAAGYISMSAVVLGTGTEHLSDACVRALRQYALSGGTLVFVGGSSFPTLTDARWRSILPATDFKSVAVDSSPALNTLAGETVKGPIRMAHGRLAPGATTLGGSKAPVVYKRDWGMGRVFVFAFSPFEPPLEHDSAIGQILARTLIDSTRSKVDRFTNAFRADSSVRGKTSVQHDPFSMTLPSTETILEVLAGYFLVVVPLNFLILKKVKRGEFAWFTAPLLSLAFAGVLFKSAESLYSAKLSTATQGVLVGQKGEPQSMFLGGSQMFIPRGGAYDLKLRGVDSLTLQDAQRHDGIPSTRVSNSFQLQPVDVGEVQVPHMRADNLAFREMYYRQRFDTNGWFDVRHLGKNKVEVVNNSPYTIANAALVHGYYREELGNLGKGQKKTITVSPGGGDRGLYNETDLRNLTGPTDRTALTGSIDALRAGPQIGSVVKDRTQVVLAYFVDGSLQ